MPVIYNTKSFPSNKLGSVLLCVMYRTLGQYLHEGSIYTLHNSNVCRKILVIKMQKYQKGMFNIALAVTTIQNQNLYFS